MALHSASARTTAIAYRAALAAGAALLLTGVARSGGGTRVRVGQFDVVLLDAGQIDARLPVAAGTAVGGAVLPWDLQVDPRQAGAGLAAHLAGRGVEFRYRTASTAVRPGRVTTALLRTGVSRVAAMVVVGDTASDMLSGVSAGAGLVVGVLTGTHDSETLEEAGADVVIASVADRAELLGLREDEIE